MFNTSLSNDTELASWGAAFATNPAKHLNSWGGENPSAPTLFVRYSYYRLGIADGHGTYSVGNGAIEFHLYFFVDSFNEFGNPQPK